MKKSVSLALFDGAKEVPMLFSKEIEKNIPLIAEMGYDGVDLFVIDPKLDYTKKAIRLLEKYNLGVGMVMPAGLARMGLFLGDKSKEVRDKIVDKMKLLINFTGDIGGMVSLGLVRGSLEQNESMNNFLDRFADTSARLVPTAERAGVELAIEPINRYEINTINSSQEGLSFIKKYKLPLKLMLDTFHMNIEDKSFNDSFIECQDYLSHVHFVDSNRLAPGSGHIDMVSIYETLKSINYDGYLCLEALRSPDGETVARNGIKFFERIDF